MSTIYLIRHGESRANAGLRTPDTARIELTEIGWKQAAAVPERLKVVPDCIIYSSYLRTKQTAQPTIEAYPSAPVEEWADVREFTYLDPDKCNDTTAEERRPMVEAYWQSLDPELQMHPAVESFAQFIDRVKAVHRRLEIAFGEKDLRVALFTHALFMKAFFQVIEKPQASVQELMNTFFDCPVIANCDILPYCLPSKRI